MKTPIGLSLFHQSRRSRLGSGIQQDCDLVAIKAVRVEAQIGRKQMTPTDRLSDFGSSLATGSDSVERVPRGRNEH
jgi:hypothetical protein